MRKTVKIISMLLAVMMMISLAACGQPESKEVKEGETQSTEKEEQPKEKAKVKLFLMSGDETRDIMNETYLSSENFKNDLPDIEVEIEACGEGYTDKLKTYHATGELPDVFYAIGSMGFIPMIKAGSVLDLLPYVNNDGFADKYIIKEVIAPHTDGKLYTLQTGADMFFIPRIYYHKDIFARYDISVPKTYDEFLEACKTLKSNDIIPWATYGADGWAVKNYLFQNLVMAEDPQVIHDLISNKTDFSNPVCINALSNIQEMVNEGVFQPGVATMEYGAVQELFTSKKAAMYGMMTWALPELVKDPEVDFMFFPQVNDSIDMSNTLQYWGAPNMGYAVSSKSKYLDAAVKVAEYSTIQEAKFFNVEQKSPTAIDTGIELEVENEIMAKNLENFRNASTKLPTLALHAFGSKLDSEFGLNAGRLLTGKFPAEEFVKAISEAWEENFE